MVAAEPRVRRRGMFVHVETPELDEHEAPEGVSTRLGVTRPRIERRHFVSVSSRKATHAVRTSSLGDSTDFRLESGTDSHRRARMSR
jgi:hypothetical protein